MFLICFREIWCPCYPEKMVLTPFYLTKAVRPQLLEAQRWNINASLHEAPRKNRRRRTLNLKCSKTLELVTEDYCHLASSGAWLACDGQQIGSVPVFLVPTPMKKLSNLLLITFWAITTELTKLERRNQVLCWQYREPQTTSTQHSYSLWHISNFFPEQNISRLATKSFFW